MIATSTRRCRATAPTCRSTGPFLDSTVFQITRRCRSGETAAITPGNAAIARSPRCELGYSITESSPRLNARTRPSSAAVTIRCPFEIAAAAIGPGTLRIFCARRVQPLDFPGSPHRRRPRAPPETSPAAAITSRRRQSVDRRRRVMLKRKYAIVGDKNRRPGWIERRRQPRRSQRQHRRRRFALSLVPPHQPRLRMRRDDLPVDLLRRIKSMPM